VNNRVRYTVNMPRAARAIVVHNQNILLMERHKDGDNYYTLPGGGIDSGETADGAVVREIKEETNLSIKLQRAVFIEDAGELYGMQFIFFADYVSGDMMLRKDSIEEWLNKNTNTVYKPVWMPVSKFARLPFRSHVLQQAILKGLREGWPQQPELLKSQAEISNK
jgi:8-oxo-dGTP diphosphatase